MSQTHASASAIVQSSLEEGKPPVGQLILQLSVFVGLALLAHGAAFVLAIPLALVVGQKVGFAMVLAILFSGVGVLIVSKFLVQRFQRLPLRAIGIGFDRPWVRHLVIGTLCGGALIALAWLIFGWCGWLTSEANPQSSGRALRLAFALLLCVATALHEEAVCRGYAFQLIYRRNPVVALVVAGLVFMGIHLLNRGGTEPVALLNLFLSHLFLAACYLRTRSLWLPIGIHIGWNFTEAFVLGLPISGKVPKGAFLRTTIEANPWTGYEFGPEGGLLVTVMFALAAIVTWRFLRQQHPATDLLAVGPTGAAGPPSRPLPEFLPPLTTNLSTPTERVLATDALRGIGVLAILPMNMQIFALHPATVFYPYAGEFTDSTNIWAWTILRVLDGSAGLIIFSMLFGAGILMMDGSSRRGGRSAVALHYRRMAVLFGFGLVHAYFIWAGDILVTYAICGCGVFLLKGLRPRWLISIGTAAFLVPMFLLLCAHLVVPRLSSEVMGSLESIFRPDAAHITAFNQAYGASWLGQMPQRASDALANQTVNVLLCMGWVAGGLMLIGIGFQKYGVLTGRAPTRTYAWMAAAAVVIGYPLLIYSLYWNFEREWRLRDGFFFGWMLRECAYPIIVLGWIGTVMLMDRHERLRAIIRPLAPVGRMALTNYLMQSVICSLLFHGHGLGWVGKVDHLNQIWITLAIWALQMIISPIWLRHYRMGPVEWLWRYLAYGRK